MNLNWLSSLYFVRMETVRSRICESCLRYNQTPIWGHTLCSGHRMCCRDDKVWKPGDCDTCLEQQDKLDLASNKVREASFREMLKMLIRTKSSKGIHENGFLKKNLKII